MPNAPIADRGLERALTRASRSAAPCSRRVRWPRSAHAASRGAAVFAPCHAVPQCHAVSRGAAIHPSSRGAAVHTRRHAVPQCSPVVTWCRPVSRRVTPCRAFAHPKFSARILSTLPVGFANLTPTRVMPSVLARAQATSACNVKRSQSPGSSSSRRRRWAGSRVSAISKHRPPSPTSMRRTACS